VRNTLSTKSAYSRTRRLLGGALVAVACLSLVVNIVLVYEIWSLRGRLTTGVEHGLDLLSETLLTSDRALTNVDNQLVVARDSLASVEQTTRNVAAMMGETRDSLRTSSTIVGTELPATVLATQTAIQNARTSARLVDDVLGALSAIPFLGVDYRPEVPLNEELGNMARSLDRLPALSTDLSKQLESTATELDDARQETDELSETLEKAQARFAESRSIVAEFRGEVGDSRAMVEQARGQAGGAITWLALGLTFVLAWLTVLQIAALALGLDWLAAPEGRLLE
jgi:hypothetical protein